MKLVLMPGFDGTGLLFAPFIRALPSDIAPVVVSYPADRVCSAKELLDIALSHLPKNEPYILLAESFSGPLALKVCHLQPQPMALILCASFGKFPFPRFAIRMLGFCWNILARCRPPRWIIRRYLVGEGAAEIESLFYKAIATASSTVLLHRLSVLREFDDQYVPESLKLPLLYLQATHDRLVNEHQVCFLKRRYPAMQIERIDSPHLVLQIQPEASARAIFNFLTHSENGALRKSL